MAGILSNTAFLLHGPASVGVLDLFRVNSLLQASEPEQSCEGEESPQHSHLASPEEQYSYSVASLEPETARRDQDDFDIELESQLEPLKHSQSSFCGFSPLSPISPISKKASQSPLMVRQTVGKKDNDTTCAADISLSPCLLQSYCHPSRQIELSEVLNKSNSLLEEEIMGVNASDKSEHLGPIGFNSFVDDELYVNNYIVAFSKDTQSSSPSSALKSGAVANNHRKERSDVGESAANDDSFLDSSNISVCFSSKCIISEKNNKTIIDEGGQQSKKKQPAVQSAQLTNEWNLPLLLKCKKQQTLCPSDCACHSSEYCPHTSSSPSYLPKHEEGPMPRDAFKSMEVIDRLDYFSAEMKDGTSDFTSLIFSYYHMQTHKMICDVLLQKSFRCHRSRQGHRKLQTNKRLLVGGVLIVASKKDIAFWDTLINCESSSRDLRTEAKFHCYTEPLSKRRKFGAFRIASHDIVLTTFDILRAKEVALPLDDSDSDSENEGDAVREDKGKCEGNKGEMRQHDQWLTQRRKINRDTTEWSNLHLIHWDRVVIDHRNLSNIRRGTVRGDAIVSLRADSRVSLIEQEAEGSPLSLSTLQDLSDFLEIRSDMLSDAYSKLD